MANDKTQSSTQGAASTVALENMAESIAKATMRALDERKLASAAGNPVNLPMGHGTTVLGIIIPPCEKGYEAGGYPPGWPCHHHVIMGIIIMPHLDKPVETTGTTPQ